MLRLHTLARSLVLVSLVGCGPTVLRDESPAGFWNESRPDTAVIVASSRDELLEEGQSVYVIRGPQGGDMIDVGVEVTGMGSDRSLVGVRIEEDGELIGQWITSPVPDADGSLHAQTQIVLTRAPTSEVVLRARARSSSAQATTELTLRAL